jgi:hypothetical protein
LGVSPVAQPPHYSGVLTGQSLCACARPVVCLVSSDPTLGIDFGSEQYPTKKPFKLLFKKKTLF